MEKDKSFEKYLDDNPEKAEKVAEAIAQDQRDKKNEKDTLEKVATFPYPPRFLGVPLIYSKLAFQMVIGLIILLIFLIYITFIRPAQVRSECKEKVRIQTFLEEIPDHQASRDKAYKECLHDAGLDYFYF